MRFISETHAYKKDQQREERGQYRFVIRDELPAIIEMLAADAPLPSKYHDHMLTGDWANQRSEWLPERVPLGTPGSPSGT